MIENDQVSRSPGAAAGILELPDFGEHIACRDFGSIWNRQVLDESRLIARDI
jgi:hypothetical protein